MIKKALMQMGSAPGSWMTIGFAEEDGVLGEEDSEVMLKDGKTGEGKVRQIFGRSAGKCRRREKNETEKVMSVEVTKSLKVGVHWCSVDLAVVFIRCQRMEFIYKPNFIYFASLNNYALSSVILHLIVC